MSRSFSENPFQGYCPKSTGHIRRSNLLLSFKAWPCVCLINFFSFDNEFIFIFFRELELLHSAAAPERVTEHQAYLKVE